MLFLKYVQYILWIQVGQIIIKRYNFFRLQKVPILNVFRNSKSSRSNQLQNFFQITFSLRLIFVHSEAFSFMLPNFLDWLCLFYLNLWIFVVIFIFCLFWGDGIVALQQRVGLGTKTGTTYFLFIRLPLDNQDKTGTMCFFLYVFP